MKTPALLKLPPLSFADLARAFLVLLGGIGSIEGLFTLTTACISNIASPNLQPFAAIIGGAVMFLGGAALVSHAWARHHDFNEIPRQAPPPANGKPQLHTVA